eukprot:TRINITY_DN11809_c0_g1_i1.p1 TRINITY_DN11809_c0_g1~~TRINITY_DN11809_c0_g1_i1.p1  ORF type:complete len:193 (+),score=11.28 TRINITY_DN11809_c0_g1_i1:707-1285(+)
MVATLEDQSNCKLTVYDANYQTFFRKTFECDASALKLFCSSKRVYYIACALMDKTIHLYESYQGKYVELGVLNPVCKPCNILLWNEDSLGNISLFFSDSITVSRWHSHKMAISEIVVDHSKDKPWIQCINCQDSLLVVGDLLGHCTGYFTETNECIGMLDTQQLEVHKIYLSSNRLVALAGNKYFIVCFNGH